MAAVTAVRELSRVELRRFARHPLVLLSLVASVGMSGVIAGTDEWRAALNGFALLPFLVLSFAVVHLAVSRDRRARAEQLVGALPVQPATRTLAALVWPVAAVVPVALAWMVFAVVRIGASGGSMVVNTWSFRDIVWEPAAVELAQPLLVAPLVVLLAVAVAHWWRQPVAAFLIPLVLFMSPLMWVVPPFVEAGMVERSGGLIEVPASAVGWHLLYLLGWIALASAVALMRHSRRFGVLALAGLGVVGVAVGFALGPLPIG